MRIKALYFGCLLASCSELALLSSPSDGGRETAQSVLCPLEIFLLTKTFEQAADVTVEYSPTGIDRILALQPVFEGFEARIVGDEAAITSHVEKRPMHARFKPFHLSLGLPTSAWFKARESREGAAFATAPGRYQLIVRYITLEQSGRSGDHLCIAASEVFTVEERSWWVTNAREDG